MPSGGTPFNWVCPFCDHAGVILEPSYQEWTERVNLENVGSEFIVKNEVIACPNPDCGQWTLKVIHFKVVYGMTTHWEHVREWQLAPPSKAKIFPDYVPAQFRQDYEEAASILYLSPKASATLSRRCLQGMIRDFWEVSKPNLFKEIDAIRDKVDPITWKAIDAVRNVGNIGAHMEKDVNVIIDVEPGEAEQLILLIETLIKEWYVHRYERQKQMEGVVALAKQKKAAKTLVPTDLPQAEA